MTKNVKIILAVAGLAIVGYLGYRWYFKKPADKKKDETTGDTSGGSTGGGGSSSREAGPDSTNTQPIVPAAIITTPITPVTQVAKPIKSKTGSQQNNEDETMAVIKLSPKTVNKAATPRYNPTPAPVVNKTVAIRSNVATKSNVKNNIGFCN